MKEQHKIDDARIAVVYEALSKGIELKNNELYDTMLEEYPYFQKVRQQRKSAVENFQKLAKARQGEGVKENVAKAKYRFEQRFIDKRAKLGAKDLERVTIDTTVEEGDNKDPYLLYSTYLD